MAIVGLSRAARVLAATVLHVDHPFLLVRRAKLGTLPVHAVGGLSRALVVFAPGKKIKISKR